MNNQQNFTNLGGFSSFSFSFTNNNGNVQQYYQSTTQAPGQAPITQSYTNTNPPSTVNPQLNFLPNFMPFFSAFGGGGQSDSDNQNASQFQPQIDPVIENYASGPQIEDITDYLADYQEDFEDEEVQMPSKVEEFDDTPSFPSSSLREHQNYEYQESLARDQELERLEEEKLIRRAQRESYFALDYQKNEVHADKINADRRCDLLVQLPVGKRVLRTFDLEENDWDDVKKWVCFELASDKSVSDEQFLLESEFELIMNFPQIVLTSGENLKRKLCEFQKEIGHKCLLFIRKN